MIILTRVERCSSILEQHSRNTENTFTGKTKSKDNQKNLHNQTNKQIFDECKEPDMREIQRYDWWEDIIPQTAA